MSSSETVLRRLRRHRSDTPAVSESWLCRGAFKELRSCPPREKEPVQPWEGDALDVDIALILFLQLVCSGFVFLSLLDRLVTFLLRAARFEAN